MIGTQAAFEDAYEAVVLAAGRRDRLDEKITTMATGSEFTPVVQRLACLRGISTLTAFALAFEIGDWDRFAGSSIGAYVGPGPVRALLRRVPQGGIAKTGNSHVRRLLVEAAWHHRKPYPPTAVLRRLLTARSSGLARRRQDRSSSARPGPLTRLAPGLRALHLDSSSLTPPGQRSRTPPTRSWQTRHPPAENP